MSLTHIKKFHALLRSKIEQIQSLLLLSIVYIIGIGITALVGKVVQKKYVSSAIGSRGNWISKKDAKTNRKMY